MEKLLHWSIEAAKDPSKAGNPDPKLLHQLFSGYDESAAMRANLQNAVESKDLDSRIESLEVFEELVENVDNANEIGNLWAPLIYLVNDPEPKVAELALSAIAYAVQNNDKSQKDLLNTNGGLQVIFEKAKHTDNVGIKSKALFALSAEIGHYPEAYDEFKKLGGLQFLAEYVKTINTEGKPLNKAETRVFSLLYAIINLEPKRDTPVELEEAGILEELRNLEPTLDTVAKDRLKLSVIDLLADYEYPFNTS